MVATRLSSPKSRQFIAWNVQKGDPSRRERYDWVDRTFLGPWAVNHWGIEVASSVGIPP